MDRRLNILPALCGLLVLAALAGCYEQRIVQDSFADLRALSDGQRRPDRGPRQLTGQAQAGGWTILVAEFQDKGHQQHGRRLVQQLIHEAFVPDLWIESGNTETRVLRGIYPSDKTDAAQRDLQLTRAIEINGSQPYTQARLVALGSDGAVISTGDSTFDLRQYSGSFSLQIGYYDQDMGPDFRQAAEEAVKVLRADGEEAYFYHGPNMSHVTLGIFGEEDRVQRVMRSTDGRDVISTTYSQRVQELRQRFPYNLGNGRTMIDTSVEGGKAMESFLVQIP